MIIHVNDLDPNKIIEVHHYITNANNGQHLAKFIKVDERDYKGVIRPCAIFDVYTTIGIQEKVMPIDEVSHTIQTYSNEGNVPVKRTMTKWRKKLKQLQEAERTIAQAVVDFDKQNG